MARIGNRTVGARLRLVLEPDIAIGPGKADLLEGIEETGSIAAAGRRLGMSYKRAWSLIESMKADFGAPLVEARRGGKAQGGADLTDLGTQVLGLYREMEADTATAVSAKLEAMRRLVGRPKGKASD